MQTYNECILKALNSKHGIFEYMHLQNVCLRLGRASQKEINF